MNSFLISLVNSFEMYKNLLQKNIQEFTLEISTEFPRKIRLVVSHGIPLENFKDFFSDFFLNPSKFFR